MPPSHSRLQPELQLQQPTSVSASPKQLAAPFAWRGGKRRVAPQVWERFGQVGHYVEPFAGGAAVLLARPEVRGLETVNDFDGLLVNFWRAMKLAPDQVVHHITYPPSDVDLQARHRWLLGRRAQLEQQLADPLYCDPLAAAWWAWGQAQAYQQRWTNTKTKPLLNTMPSGPNRLDAGELLAGLVKRMQRVVVLRRDWAAVVADRMLFRNNMKSVAVFLDPPYDGDEGVYAAKNPVAKAVWDWAIEHASDERLRIAVCGYDDGRPTPRGWRVLAWSSSGGGARRAQERIWFSPHCLEGAVAG